MCQQSSSCPPLPGSLCSGSAFSVTFQSANAVLASRALRRDLLTGESHLPHDFSCLFSPLATCQSPLLLSLLFATHPKKRPISPFLATLPNTPSRKSFVCHTSKTPPGASAPAPPSNVQIFQGATRRRSPAPLKSTLTSRAQLIENTAALSLLDATLKRFCAVTHLESTLTKKR